jgi:hypothetical protein
MMNVTVTGGYADFKTVVNALGKTSAVFWTRENPTSVKMWALTENHVVHTSFAVPVPSTSPVSLADGSPASPLAIARAPAGADAPKAGAPGTPGGPAVPAAAQGKPKTVLETDFPGAIELPGGAIVFA